MSVTDGRVAPAATKERPTRRASAELWAWWAGTAVVVAVQLVGVVQLVLWIAPRLPSWWPS